MNFGLHNNERENYNTFQDHRSRRNYKYHYRDKYERGFYNTFQDHGNSRDRSHHYYERDRSYNRDRL